VAQRGAIKVELAGLLGHYTSRHCDLGGYWLHGQLQPASSPCVIDLLGEPPSGRAPRDAAHRLAISAFLDQLDKARIPIDRVSEASLSVSADSDLVEGWRGARRAVGRQVRFVARAALGNGRVHACESTVFVAPHDPTQESQRVQSMWGT
jgi:hypothetical protein